MVELGEHQFLLCVCSEAGVSTSFLATLVNTDQEEFIVASAIVDNIGPPAKQVRIAFLDSARSVVEIDDASSSRFVRELMDGTVLELQVAVPLESTFLSPSFSACLTWGT